MPGGKSNFERLLDAATSAMLLEPNWVTNLEICDSIRQNDVTPKYALVSIRKRLKDSNPHVCKFALVVLETCVKNCGEGFHDELASHEFMNEMRNLAQTGTAPVKEQVLSMLQAWNHAFRNNTKYQPVLATYNLMKMEGYEFPPMSESDAMFSSDSAPTWKEGDVCHLCRVKFGTFTRQHHCRACGEVFCSTCSSKKSIIPKIGIEREVRVCDPCFDEINPNAGNASSGSSRKDDDENESDLPAEYLNSALAKEPQTKPKLSEDEVKQQEEDELQLALALSLSQEEAEKSTKKNWSAPASTSSSLYSSISSAPPSNSALSSNSSASSYTSPYSSSVASLGGSDRQETSELDKYLDRSYWEKKKLEVSRTPTAPVVVDQQPTLVPPQQQPVTNGDMYNSNEYQASGQDQEIEDEDEEEQYASDAFVNTMEKSIDMFVQHMSKAQMKGKHIAMDTSVQSLFHSLSAMHPQLLQLIEDEEESKAKYEAMLNKLAVIREARETLNDMRAQHEEKMKQQELEQEMLRRMQMEQKLELMRQQKQEYLEYQRQLQIQRQMDLDNYQRDKLIHKQVPTKVPPQVMGAYANGYATYPQQTSIQQQYPGSVPQQPSTDSLDGDIMPPPPYSTLQGSKPTGTVMPNMSYQDHVYQNVQLQQQQQDQPQQYNQVAPTQPQNQGQWSQPPVSMKQPQQQPLPPQYQAQSQQPTPQQPPPHMLSQQVASQPQVVQQAPAPGQPMHPPQPNPMPPPSQPQYQQPGYQQQPPAPSMKQVPQPHQPPAQQAPHHQVPPQHQQMPPQQIASQQQQQQPIPNMAPSHQQPMAQPQSHQQPQFGQPQSSQQQPSYGQPPSIQQIGPPQGNQQQQVTQPPAHQQFQNPQYQDQSNQPYQQQQQFYAQPPAPQYEEQMSANMKDLQLISFD